MTTDSVFIPNIQVTGRYPTLSRVKTGLFSLDAALSNKADLGLPLQVLVELFGYTGAGKSTLAYYLSGKVASELGRSKIAIADLEFADTQGYIPRAVGQSGFEGEVKMMDLTDEKGKPLPHSKILMSLLKSLVFDDEVGAIIWDSIGATQATVQWNELFSEKGKEFGQAFMGKKPFMVGQIADAISSALQTKKATAIALNHVHPNINAHGHNTPGGERKKYLAGVRIMIWKGMAYRLDDDDNTSPLLGMLVHGQVEKLRFGSPNRHFTYYIVPGYGVHVGASAMFDAFHYGHAESKTRVKLNGKSTGYFLKKDLLAYAAEGRTRRFDGFVEVMQQHAEKVERGEIELEEPDVPVGDDRSEE